MRHVKIRSTTDKKRGEIQLIIGCMFSGKTTELMRRCKRYRIAGKKCVVVKHIDDTRYSATKASTHDRVLMDALSVPQLSKVPKHAIESAEVICVDEGQFYPDIVNFCETHAQRGRTIIVAALDGDFKRKPFGHICELIPMAERVEKLSAICQMCHSEAHFTMRTSNKKCTAVKIVGGSNLYAAVCRNCHAATSRIVKKK